MLRLGFGILRRKVLQDSNALVAQCLQFGVILSEVLVGFTPTDTPLVSASFEVRHLLSGFLRPTLILQRVRVQHLDAGIVVLHLGVIRQSFGARLHLEGFHLLLESSESFFDWTMLSHESILPKSYEKSRRN